MATLMSGSRVQPAACVVLSSSIKHHLGFNSLRRSNCSFSHFHHSPFSFRRSGARRALSVSMSVSPLEACVKASITVPNKLGDCNFFFSFLVFFSVLHFCDLSTGYATVGSFFYKIIRGFFFVNGY